MDETMRELINKELSSWKTDDLVDVWKQQKIDEWEPETFSVIRDILIKRLGKVPDVPAEILLPRIFLILEDCLKMKEYERGLIESNEAIRVAPENAEAHNYRGLFFDYLGQSDKALEEYKEAVTLDPGFENARENLYSILNDLSEKSRVQATGLPQSMNMDSSLDAQIRESFRLMDTEALLNIWRDHNIDEWTPQAFDILFEILRGRLGNVPEITGSPTLHISLSEIQKFRKKKDYINALNMCRKALNEAPDSPIANYLHGLVLMDLGRNGEASTAFSKTVSLDPNNKDAGNLLKKLEKAQDTEFEQSNVMKYLEEALEYARDEDFDLAAREMERARPQLPESASAFTTFGEVLLAINRPDEALEYFDKAIHLNPDYSRARTGMRDARVYLNTQPLHSEKEIDPAEIEEIEKQAETFDEEEFDQSQEEVEETPDWVYLGKDAVQVSGTPGHRNRSGRSGLDPLDTQMDAYRFQGGVARRLFTGHLRTHDPIYLSMMFFTGTFFLFPLPFILGTPGIVNDLSGRITFTCFLAPLMLTGFMFYYNIVLSFLSEEPEGFEESNDKFF